MANKLTSFDFDAAKKKKQASPLDVYLDGSIWSLDLEDMKNLEMEMGYGDTYRELINLKLALYNRARRLGQKTKSAIVDDRLIVQCVEQD